MKVQYGLKDSLKLSMAKGIVKPDLEVVKSANRSAFICVTMALLATFCLIASCAHAESFKTTQTPIYTDEQIANAIKLSEGKNKKGWYSYGIKSVKCETEKECRQICKRTVFNNRLRYKESIDSRSMDFISFLSRRYAPVGAGNDPTGLNKNWLKNVKYFLNHEKKG